MIALAVLVNAVLGALWRRWLGGWRPFGWDAPGGRLLKWAAFGALCWPLYIALPWWGAALAVAALVLFLTVRTDNGGPGWRPVWRYGPAGLGYVLAREQRWPWLFWTEWGELWLGASVFGLLPGLLLLQAYTNQ